MVKNTIISVNKANSLFWLGRYEERVYITLHLMRKCYDKMIDGEMEDYRPFWQKLDPFGVYQTNEEFTLGMMYDDGNPSSVMSAQTKAMDNAILLREEIMSETLSYLEMSVALLKKCVDKQETNVMILQPVIDWSLAFWGAAEQRLLNHKARLLPGLLDDHIECQLDSLIIREKYDLNDLDYKNKLLAFVNQLVRV